MSAACRMNETPIPQWRSLCSQFYFPRRAEAALIIGIVLGALKKINRPDLNRAVWAGVWPPRP
jgi:hypothetical protein